ncbi:MAG: pentapeptide repeat-containing protein, partial [Pseudomonadota bacterium]
MADTPPQIERINALTVNARNTWFVLLGALVFVGITLMGVEHIDFYGVDRATTLPLVNVEVPTRLFFAAAPILVAAIYSYFHLYLIRLWDALSDADATVNDRPLGDAITPWLITDAALYLRTQLRDEPTPSARHRLLEGSAMVLNFAIAWAFGLIVLFFLWWLSMPARTFWMTFVAGLSLFGAAFVGATSLFLMVMRMRIRHVGTQRHVFITLPRLSTLLVTLPLIVFLSYYRTNGGTDWPAPLQLFGEKIVERPSGWLPYRLAKADHFEAWCRRVASTCDTPVELEDEEIRAFESDFDERRAIAVLDLLQPNWSQRAASKPDFRRAQLNAAFLVGANLQGAHMEYASLVAASLEAADLSNSHLFRADFDYAEMQNADLSGAVIVEADFAKAQLDGVDMSNAKMFLADFTEAQMHGARLNRADMPYVKLDKTQMAGAE